MSANKVTALVPCFNEGKRISSLLKVLTSSQYIDHVIVVDDGSKDDSKQVIKNFKTVELIELPKNVGKGGALKVGIGKVKSPITFMCDADIGGLTDTEIGKLILPVLKHNYDATLGVLVGALRVKWRLVQYIRRRVMVLTGERVLKTDLLRTVLDSEYSKEWGLEAYMNFYFRIKKKKVKICDIESTYTPFQIEKVGFIKWLRIRVLNLSKIYMRILYLEVRARIDKDFYKSLG